MLGQSADFVRQSPCKFGLNTFAMMFEQPRIRIATSADAEQLAALAERTFRDTFADDNSTDDMDAYVRDSFSLDRVRDELADDANAFLVAFVEGKKLPDGYAKLRTGTTHRPKYPWARGGRRSHAGEPRGGPTVGSSNALARCVGTQHASDFFL